MAVDSFCDPYSSQVLQFIDLFLREATEAIIIKLYFHRLK